MPIFESMSDHGYDCTNYYKIKSNLGTTNDLKELSIEAKKYNIKLILDLVNNHVGSAHPWFSHPDKNQRKDHWFIWSPVDRRWGPPWPWGTYSPTWRKDPYPHYDRTGSGRNDDDTWFYGAFDDKMPDFNYNNPNSRKEVIDEFVKIMKYWYDETGISGFRCDAVRYLVENGEGAGQRDQKETHEIWREYRRRVEAIDPELILLSEAPTEDYQTMLRYYGTEAQPEFHAGFHFIYNYQLMETLKLYRRPAGLLRDLHVIQNNLPRGTQDFIFLTNHDQFTGDRVATQLQNQVFRIKSIASLYLLLSGAPTIYYGEEYGMEGCCNDPGIRQPMDWRRVENQLNDPNSIVNHYKRILKIRNHYEPLRLGRSIYVRTQSVDGWDDYNRESRWMTLVRKVNDNELVIIVHGFSGINSRIHLNLDGVVSTMLEKSNVKRLQVHNIMGSYMNIQYPEINEQNKRYYPMGEHLGFTTKVLFVGNIDKYRDRNGRYPTYENALGFYFTNK